VGDFVSRIALPGYVEIPDQPVLNSGRGMFELKLKVKSTMGVLDKPVTITEVTSFV